MTDEHESSRLSEIIADYLQRVEAGEAVDHAALLKQHPEFANELRAFLADDLQWKRVAAGEGSEVSPTMNVSSSETPASNIEPTFDSNAAPGATAGASPQRVGYFGDYELLEEIARGGMGVVYKARQVNLDRTVALKMILTGQLASEDDVKRFQQEAEAAANLDHPGIVPIFEIGEHESQHFFSMAYVEGPSLAGLLADGPLPPHAAAQLVQQVAQAIAFAHNNGVIHRDLKPANILLARYRGKESGGSRTGVEIQAVADNPNRGGVYEPKVTDFGLAKRTQGADELTNTGQILGTPSFMPPEQAAGQTKEIGPAADVYSLGAILYCALTGHPPFQAANPMDTLLQVVNNDPPSPRQLNPSTPRDLETICLKCLHKEPNQRYASAEELAAELGRYVRGEPIHARPISGFERGWRWCRRNPALAGLWGLCAAVLLALGIGGPLLALQQQEIARNESKLRKNAEDAREDANNKRIEADKQREIATDEKLRAQENLVSGQLLLGKIAREKGDIAESINWYLQAYLNSTPKNSTRLGARNLISAWGVNLEATLVHRSGIDGFAVSPDSKRILVSPLGSAEQMWDLETYEQIGEAVSYHGDTGFAQFTPDGESIVTGGWGDAARWDAETSTKRVAFKSREAHEGDQGFGFKLSPDGRTVATATTRNDITLWDADTGTQRGKTLKVGHNAYSVRFSSDSKWLFTFGVQKILRVWEVETGVALGKPLKNVADHDFDASNQILAVCTEDDGKIKLLNISDQSIVREFDPEFQAIQVEFDPAGRHLLASGNGKSILWQNVLSPESVSQQFAAAQAAKFSPDGKLVATSEHLGIKVWEVGRDRPTWQKQINGGYQSLEFAPDSQSLLVRNYNHGLQLLQASAGKTMYEEEQVRVAKFTPDGKKLIVGSQKGWARIIKIAAVDPRKIQTVIQIEDSHHTEFHLAANGNLAVTQKIETVQFWDPKTWRPMGDPLELAGLQRIEVSPDGKIYAAIVETKKPVGLSIQGNYRPGTYQLEFRETVSHLMLGQPVPLPFDNPHFMKFDITGKSLAFFTKLIDVETRQWTELLREGWRDQNERPLAHFVERSNLPGPAPKLWDEKTNAMATLRLPGTSLDTVRLSENGQVFVTQHESGAVQTWDAATTKPLGPPMPVDGRPTFVSNDGRYVACVNDSAVAIWDAHTGKPCGTPLYDGFRKPNPLIRFFGDETKCVTNNGHIFALWDCATGQMLGPPLDARGIVRFRQDKRPCFMVSHNYSTPWRVEEWRFPQPADDDPWRLQLSVEVRTGLRVDENGTLRRLGHRDWLDRKTQLKNLGGPCDVR